MKHTGMTHKGLVSLHTSFILSALAGPLSSCSPWITGIPGAFAPGSTGSHDQLYLLPLPQGLTLSKTKLFSLKEFELGKLLQWHKGPPFSPAEMPAIKFNLVINLFLREHLLFPLCITLSLVCPVPPIIKFLFCEVEKNNVFLWDTF